MKSKSKQGQDKKSMIFSLHSKRAQEEMIGFALIIMIVAIILLIFLGFSLTRPQTERIESYEAESFMQSMLQYTSDCSDNLEKMPVEKLVLRCNSNSQCLDGRSACSALNETISGIIAESWKIGNTPVAGYDLKIFTKDKQILSLEKGNKTGNYKGTTSNLPQDIKVQFNAYY
ncbi:MAG TPA: hypothetical protein VJ438_06555 [Candidatus Nanoarchaeia archaeon]|nr:hypothetical protein [Candidatus Nanoarchaeia archaeon]